MRREVSLLCFWSHRKGDVPQMVSTLPFGEFRRRPPPPSKFHLWQLVLVQFRGSSGGRRFRKSHQVKGREVWLCLGSSSFYLFEHRTAGCQVPVSGAPSFAFLAKGGIARSKPAGPGQSSLHGRDGRRPRALKGRSARSPARSRGDVLGIDRIGGPAPLGWRCASTRNETEVDPCALRYFLLNEKMK